MKIFITKFIHDGQEYCGPNIHAEDLEIAQAIAEIDGYIVQGELTDLVQFKKDEKRVLH